MSRGLTLLLLVFALLYGAAAARAGDGPEVGRRVALVVGNSNYVNAQLALSNPRNDAEDVSAALGALGFDVVSATDLNLAAFDSAVATFKDKAKGAEVALFFYAGHAVQSDHVNYFIPVDANITQEAQLKRGAISLNDVQEALSGTQGVQVLILDSCRDNPFSTLKAASRSLAMTRGLERITVTAGDSVVLYSTRANDVASDGATGARNSPFSRVLLDVLKRPGEHNLREMLWDVAAKVKAESGGKQSPELTMSLSGDYLFNLVNDRLEWDTVRTSLDPRVFRAYATRFPQSPFRQQAERYAGVLEQQQFARRREADTQARKANDARAAQQKAADDARVCWENYQKLDLLRTGRDRGGLERLAHDNACPTLQSQIDSALASLIDADHRQACDRVDAEIGDYLQARNAAGLKALGSEAAACPGLADRVAQALASVEVAERQQREAESRQREAERQQAVCDQESARLAALAGGSRRSDEVAALGAGARCDKVRTDALALAADLRRQEAQAARDARQRAVCGTEGDALRDALDKGPRSSLEALGAKHECETLDVASALAQFDDRAENRRKEALKACAAADVDGLVSREDEKGLLDLSAKCPSRADDVATAVTALKDKRRVADACRREGDQLQRLVGARQSAAVTALGGSATCPTLDIPGALAAIAGANCAAGLKAVGMTRDDDEATLHGYADGAEVCTEVRTAAQTRLDALAGARRNDADCDRDLAEAQARGDVGTLKGLLARDGCARRKDAVARALDEQVRKAEQSRQAQLTCDKAVAAVGILAATDEASLRRAAGDGAACPAARSAADARLDTLLAMRRDDASCDAAVTGAASRGDVPALKALQGDPSCARRRDAVARAIDGEARKAEQQRLAQAACDKAAAAFGTVSDEAALRRATGDGTVCPAARTAAGARLDTLLAMRRDDASCDAAVDVASGRSDLPALRALQADPSCVRRRDAVARAIDGEGRKAEQQRLAQAACDKAAAAFGTVSDEAALRRATGDGTVCPAARTAAGARLDTLLAMRRDDASCDAAVEAASGRSDLSALRALEADPSCLRRRDVVARAVDGENRKVEQARVAKATCDDAVGKVAALATADEAGLRRATGDGTLCPAARTAAAGKLDALLALRTQDATCDGAVADATGRGDIDGLRALGDDPNCVRRRDAVAQAVQGEQRKAEQVRLARADCDRATASTGAEFAEDEGALRRLSGDDGLCPVARGAASARLEKLAALHDEVDRGCDTAVAAAADAVDVERIAQLVSDPTCVRRRPAVAAALKTAGKARIVDGQQRLAGLGCLKGRASGSFDAATGDAVARYLNAKHVGGPAPTAFSADLIRDLSAESQPVCIQEASLSPKPEEPPVKPQAVEPPAEPKPVSRPPSRNTDEEDETPRRKKRKPAPVAEPERPQRPRERVIAQPSIRRAPVARAERPARAEPAPPVTTQSSSPKMSTFY